MESMEVRFATMQRDLHHMREKMDELFEEVREANRILKADHTALELRVRNLEEERIRMRTMLIPFSIILSALLSFGTTQVVDFMSSQPPAAKEVSK
jgi:hypothetical protein